MGTRVKINMDKQDESDISTSCEGIAIPPSEVSIKSHRKSSLSSNSSVVDVPSTATEHVQISLDKKDESDITAIPPSEVSVESGRAHRKSSSSTSLSEVVHSTKKTKSASIRPSIGT